MRRQFLCGAAAILATLALAGCDPYYYGYGYGPGYYGYGGYGPYAYGPYGAPPPPPMSATQAPPAAAGPAVTQNVAPPAAYPATCYKGLLWPFIREPGDCPTDAEKYSNYPPLWYVR